MDLAREAAALLDHLAGVEAAPLSIALALHLARRAARARAWQLVVGSVHPGAGLRYGTALAACLGALAAGALSPVRGGELARIALVKLRLREARPSTLAATLAVEGAVDACLAALLVGGAFLGGALPLGGLAAAAPGRVAILRANVRRGLAVLGDRRVLARGVVPWLALSWVLRLAAISLFLEAFSIPATPGLAAAVVASQCLAGLVPLTWLGATAQQGLAVVVLAEAAGAGQAVAFSLGAQAATLAFNVLSGTVAVAFLLPSLRVRTLPVLGRLTIFGHGEVSELA